MIETLFIGFCVICVITLLQHLYRTRARSKSIDKLPGPTRYPLIGNSIQFAVTPRSKRLSAIKELTDKYGSLHRTWFGNFGVVHIREPEAAEILLTSRANINKSHGYHFFEEWLGTGLLTAGGSKWRSRRKMLTPTFHFSILETFFDTFVDTGKIFLEKLEKETHSEEFDIYPYITNCTLDIICETAMGVKINAQNESSEYIHAIKVINECLIHRSFRPWLWPNFIYYFTKQHRQGRDALRILHNMSNEVIKKRMQTRKEATQDDDTAFDSDIGIKKKKAFLDLLLEISENSSERLTNSDIREEVDTFMFEGHDTTTTGLSWTIYMLGLHPDVQDKVVSELKEVLGSLERHPKMKEVAELKYMECVIKESLRLFPPVPSIARTLTEDIKFGEYQIPAGTLAEINIYLLHRNRNHFPDPEKFDPDNFSAERNKSRHPFAFIPFSAGPRNCIGQKFAMLEEKVLLAMFLSKYKVTSLDKVEDLILIPEVILRSENGIRVRISERS